MSFTEIDKYPHETWSLKCFIMLLSFKNIILISTFSVALSLPLIYGFSVPVCMCTPVPHCFTNQVDL